jgi:DNA repair protein RadC
MKISDNIKKEPHYLGHRKRLKEKFLSGNAASFSDYELLELLLFQAIPRRDIKPIAKAMLERFGSLKAIIHATEDKFSDMPIIKEASYLQFKLIRELLNRILYEEVKQQNIISSWGALLNYLKFNMSYIALEQFRILFLNKKNILLADEVMGSGTIDQIAVYPREIVKKALFYEAGAVILVHNHPSGDAQPSRADIELTKQIVAACKLVNVEVHDHVIIGKDTYYSFKSEMLL